MYLIFVDINLTFQIFALKFNYINNIRIVKLTLYNVNN